MTRPRRRASATPGSRSVVIMAKSVGWAESSKAHHDQVDCKPQGGPRRLGPPYKLSLLEPPVARFKMSRFIETPAAARDPVGDPGDQLVGPDVRRTEQLQSTFGVAQERGVRFRPGETDLAIHKLAELLAHAPHR